MEEDILDEARNKRIFFGFLLGIAAVGCLFLAFSLLRPHSIGVVLSVGRVSQVTAHSGKGIHRSEHVRLAADVKVQVKGTSRRETVYYRVPNASYLPQVGDEVAFANSWLVGNTPYPELWAVWMGIALLGLDALAVLGYWIIRLRRGRNPRGGGEEAWERRE